ncbi:hypothetical protein, partial [Iodidimonas muriae]|uniref:hypothetical protein n=1 Tax=Iodidimonas muriae TaxID=261467 RepID=UPI001E2C2FAB
LSLKHIVRLGCGGFRQHPGQPSLKPFGAHKVDVKEILFFVGSTVAGVLIAGVIMGQGRKLPGLKQAHEGYDS